MNILTSTVADVSRLLRDRGGNFGIMTAILVPVLIGTVGVAVDISNMVLGQRQLQEAADAAALAAVSALANGKVTVNNAQAYATDFVTGQMSNFVDAATIASIRSSINVQVVPTTTSTGTSYQVTVTPTYAMSVTPFTRVIGYNTVNIAATSVSTGGVSQTKAALSMALVLDESGSMLANTETRDPTQSQCDQYNDNGSYTGTGNCYIKKIDALKSAANLLLDQLDKADPNSKYARTSAIGWSNTVKISSSFVWGTKDTRTNVINKLSAGNGTESYAPMLQAYNSLTTTNRKSETRVQTDAGNTILTKYIVLMTDGTNNASSSDTDTLTVCTNAKNAGIKIYSIALMAPTHGQDLLNQCSSGPGYFYKADGMTELLAAFKDIGQQAAADKTLLTQ